MKRATDLVQDFFLKPTTGELLSLLRIVVGTMMFLKAAWLFPHIDDLYGQYGYLQAHLMDAVIGPNISSWAVKNGITAAQYSAFLHVFFVVHMIAGLSFALGFRTKIANVVLWLTQMAMFRMAWVSAYGIDSYCHNLCFLMLWLPVARYWSLDAWIKGEANVDRRPDPVCTLGIRCLQIYILMTYVDAGVSKALGTDWWSGAAIWEVLHLPEFNHIDFYWMADYPWIPKALALGTLFFESFYIVGAWIPRVGKLWTMAIISMHLGIAFLMGLTLFGITLALINAVLFLYPIEGLNAGRAPDAAAELEGVPASLFGSTGQIA